MAGTRFVEHQPRPDELAWTDAYMSSPAESPATGQPPRSAMFTAFLVVFIDLLGFGIVLPVLPRIVDRYAGSLGISEFEKGVLGGVALAAFSLMQFIFAPVWGRVSDRVGRKPILMLGLGGSVVFYSLFAYAVSLPPEQGLLAMSFVLLSRFGAGIAGATISTAQAVIADCTTPENRSRGMALIGVAFGIGFTFGPLLAALGGLVAPERFEVPGIMAAGLSFIALLLCWRKFRETHTPGAVSRAAQHRGRFGFDRTLRVLRLPLIGLLVLTYFFSTFGFAFFEGTLSFFTLEVLNYDVRENYYAFAAVGLTLALVQGGLYRRLAKKYDESLLMRIGLLLMFLGLLHLGGVAAMANDPEMKGWLGAWFYSACIIAVSGFAFVTPSLTGLISRLTPKETQGEVLGVNQGFSALARILGPLMGATLFYTTASHALPYVVASIALGIVMVMIFRIPRGVHGLPRKVVVGKLPQE